MCLKSEVYWSTIGRVQTPQLFNLVYPEEIVSEAQRRDACYKWENYKAASNDRLQKMLGTE